MWDELLKNNISSILISFLCTFSLTPIMIKIAKKYNIVDIPNSRKSHKDPTPLLGGVAIFFGSILAILLNAHPLDKYVIPLLCLALFGIMVMGLIDDIVSLKAQFRLLILFLVSTGIIGVLQFFYEGNILVHGIILNIIFIIFNIIWIVAITNAINWSDGLDGLASTEALIAAIGFAIIIWMQGRNQLSLPIALALCGALLGFLPYNISPAKIFMGDAGSMFVGFLLGVLSIISIKGEETYFALIVPIFFLILPIFDMYIVIIRRIFEKRSIILPDKQHLHHKLNEKLESHRLVVLIIALSQAFFVAFGIAIYITKSFYIGWILFIVSTIIISIIIFINSRKKLAKQKMS